MFLLNQVVFIMAFTVGIQFTFRCGTCDVSTLVGMTRHNICIIKMLGYNRLQDNILNRLFLITFVMLQCNISYNVTTEHSYLRLSALAD